MTAHPTVIPMIAYEDGPAAMDWLASAFGFRELERRVTAEGRLAHGEMELDGGVIMMATPSPDYHGPRKHREECEQARLWSQVPYIVDGLLVYVRDVAAHHARAKSAGALILSAPEESPDGTRYRAEDLEGHRWMFIQRA